MISINHKGEFLILFTFKGNWGTTYSLDLSAIYESNQKIFILSFCSAIPRGPYAPEGTKTKPRRSAHVIDERCLYDTT